MLGDLTSHTHTHTPSGGWHVAGEEEVWHVPEECERHNHHVGVDDVLVGDLLVAAGRVDHVGLESRVGMLLDLIFPLHVSGRGPQSERRHNRVVGVRALQSHLLAEMVGAHDQGGFRTEGVLQGRGTL